MAVRSSMAQLVAFTRDLINDQPGATQMFSDQQVQDALDRYRDEVRYEPLAPMPSIVNAASTNNIPQVIWADYESRYHYWEADVVIQGNQIPGGGAWLVLSPVGSDYITGRFQFQLTPFTNGTAPGQYPPVWATGKVYDPYVTASDLLRMWASRVALAYDGTVAGQTFHRSQQFTQLMKIADAMRCRGRVRVAIRRRNDHATEGAASYIVPVLGMNDELVR